VADDETDPDEWIDIDQARVLTGKSRKTLMIWKRDQEVAARTEDATFTQRQKRVLFKRSDLLKKIGEQI
jgi:hypothetical protein